MTLHSLNQITHRMDDAASVIAVLDAIGMPLRRGADTLSAGVISPETLIATADGFSESQLDEALDKTKLPPGDRMTIKYAMSQHRLLRKVANA